MFNSPTGVCVSTDGKIYVADYQNHRIIMIHNNEVTKIAGNGQKGFQDGNALEAMFNCPSGICISTDGRIYVSDYKNHRIRMIYNNEVTTIAGTGRLGFKDGNALDAKFDQPDGICMSPDGRIYVADHDNHRIRMIYNNEVSTIAGNGEEGFQDGNALEAMFNSPSAICISTDGRIYVCDMYNDRIRMIHNNEVTTIAGSGEKGFKDGNALEAMFEWPNGICMSSDGVLYVADTWNHRIRRIYNNEVTTIAGSSEKGFKDGNALEAMFAFPTAICMSADGRIYAADSENHKIRMIAHC